MKIILLSKGLSCVVDDEDYEWLSKYSWHVNDWGYAVRSCKAESGKCTTIRMARAIMCATKGIEVDHINRDKLDNRRSNLRLVDKKQNVWNRGPNGNNHLGIKGVGWHKRIKKFHARIRTTDELIHIGYFDSADEARSAYLRKATELRGEFAI